MTAKGKRTTKQWASIAGVTLALAAGEYKFDFVNVPGCNAKAMNPADFVAAKTFDTYVTEHQRFAETTLNGIDQKFEAIRDTLALDRTNAGEWRRNTDGKLDQILGLLMTRRADSEVPDWDAECSVSE